MHNEGTSEDFTRLFNEHFLAVRRFTLRRLSDAKTCEDVVAETFLIAWRRWDDLPVRDRELRWLYGIAFRVLSNQRRSRDRRNRLHTRLSFERSPESGEVDGYVIDVVRVRHALFELRASERELLEFIYWEKLSYREIAEIVGISENAVGIRISRAKVNLKTLLAPLLNDEGDLISFGEEFES